MAKTFTNLYPAIHDFENLFNAYLKARRNKRYRSEALQFTANLEENLIQIQNELIYHTYKTGRYREFYVYEPKKRLIMALPFKDRVVQHALCNVIEPIFEARFIFDSYACRVGKGTHAGANRVTHFLRVAKRRWDDVYCLKADIKQYFPSINHNILKTIIRRRIRCKETLWLIEEIIDSTADYGDVNPVGIPIGNLTSQLFANVYLNELDQYVKQEKRLEYYVRYMDDFVILHNDKSYLHQLKKDLEGFLSDHLALSLNHKTSVFPIRQGVDFLGYRIWPTHRLLRKSSIKRMKRRLKKFTRDYRDGKIQISQIRPVLASWIGHASHADSYGVRKKILSTFKLV